ncbi:hypothetical protein D3C73_1212990 [compost metagenome]
MPADLQPGPADAGKSIIHAVVRRQREAREIAGGIGRRTVKPADYLADRPDRQGNKRRQRAEPGSGTDNGRRGVIIAAGRMHRHAAFAGREIQHPRIRQQLSAMRQSKPAVCGDAPFAVQVACIRLIHRRE